MRRWITLSTLLFLSACSTTQVAVKQHQYNGEVHDRPIMIVGTVIDHREHAPNWLGAIRGGFGNPLKTLETDTPVNQVVADAVETGLRQRGLLSSGSDHQYRLSADLMQFDCNQYVRREAHIKLNVKVTDISSGKEVYSKLLVKDKVEGSVLSLKTGIFASTDDLLILAQKTLNQALEELFSDPDFSALYASRS